MSSQTAPDVEQKIKPMRVVSITLAAWLTVGAIAGGPEFQVVPVETGAEPIDRIFVFDLLIPLDELEWLASTVELASTGGAILQYNVRQDANGVDQPLAGPGADRPFNTFISSPRRPFAPSRFDNANLGGLAASVAAPILDPHRFSADVFMTSGLTFPAPAMAVMRVAFKAPQVGLSFGDVYFTTAARSGFDDPNTAAPSDASHTRLIAIRSSHTLFPHAAPNLNGAFFAVPEPAGCALLALGAALGFRRR